MINPEQRLEEKRAELEELKDEKSWWIPLLAGAFILSGAIGVVGVATAKLQEVEAVEIPFVLPIPGWYWLIPVLLGAALARVFLTDPTIQRIEEVQREIVELEQDLE